MKIKDIEVIKVAIPYVERIREHLCAAVRPGEPEGTGSAEMFVYRVYTDENLVGIGEGWVGLTDNQIKGYIGKSPFDFILSDDVGQLAIAFYDLMGKAIGEPVHKFFGSKLRDEIPMCYWSQCYPPEVLAKDAQYAVKRGFKFHKIKARKFRDPIEQFEAIANVTPSDYRIIVDANETFETPSNTLRLVEKYKKYNRLWALEEPIPRWNLKEYEVLKQKLRYPLATHLEITRVYSRGKTYEENSAEKTLLQTSACDIFVYQTTLLGRSMQYVTGIAKATGKSIWMENGLYSGISAVFQAHQALTVPNLELCITLVPILEDDLIVEPIKIKEGCMQVPEAPGLGIQLDDKAIKKYSVN